MRDKLKGVVVGVVAVAALAVGGAAIAGATGGGGDAGKEKDTPITGSALDTASSAALKSTGGGKVTGTEAGDEESYYQVEVTRPDGTQVDVQLDRGFNVLGSKAEHADGSEQGQDEGAEGSKADQEGAEGPEQGQHEGPEGSNAGDHGGQNDD
jgi:hypothetical protein